MTYDLFIGDRMFSSWSLRGWLMFEKFSLPYRTNIVGLYSGTFQQDLAPLAPAHLVPVVRTPSGDVIGESMAIAETLAEQNPAAGMWPKHPSLRARARWLCAEMSAGFHALRSECPMQLAHINRGFKASDGVKADIARIDKIWRSARSISGSDGWLLGEYCLADVFYAPVAARIMGYDLDVSDHLRAYSLRTINDAAFKSWRAEGMKISYDPFPYPKHPPIEPWPVE